MDTIKKLNVFTLKYFVISVLLLVFSNALFFLLAKHFGLVRTVVNIDYLLPLLLLALNKRILFFVSFIVLSVTDFLLLFMQIFPIIRFGDILYLFKFAWITSDSYKMMGVGLFIAVLLQTFMVFKATKQQYFLSFLILLNVLLFSLAYIENVAPEEVKKERGNFWKPKNLLISSQSMDYYNYLDGSFLRTHDMQGGSPFQDVEVKGAADALWDISKQNDKVLLILNESWGVPIRNGVQEDVLSPITKLDYISDYKLDQRDFLGYTIGGEMRELCHKALNYFNLKNQEEGFEGCLPHKYKKAGYHTTAVHGALGMMYDRKYWYPRVGFDTTLFRDSGLNLPDSFCYSFPGNCDKDIAKRVQEQFIQHDKLFLYWLTLSTHSTYDKRDLVVDLFDCRKYDIPAGPACRNLKLQKQFFYYLGEVLKDPAFKGTKVFVVADHEPPMITTEGREFVEEQIPAVSFTVQ